MLEKEKKSERLDYLDGLPEDFVDFINETRAINELNKSERLSSKSYNSNDSKSSFEKITSEKLIKSFEKIKIDQNQSKDLQDSNLDDKYIPNNKKVLSEINKEHKNIKKKFKDIFSNLDYDLHDFQDNYYDEEYYEELYDTSNKNIEPNPHYEQAQYYDDYLNNEEDSYEFENMPNDDFDDNYNEIPRDNFFVKEQTNNCFKKDLI